MKKAYVHLLASAALLSAALASPAASTAQMDLGPKVEKTFGQGLPRDRDRLIFDDDQYPVWPLTPAQSQYASINGMRMKGHVVALSQIALRDRDRGHKWWGRLPGTEADKETMAYLTKEFESLGMKVEHFPYVLPHDWRPSDWSMSYRTADGATIELTTAFPVADTKDTGPQGITADAIWVGVGSGADFLGRDVRGKAVVIYSTFVPGGRSHSASDRSGLFNANTRAVEQGAAMVINIMGVPGNGQFQPEGGLPQIPQFTLSMDEGFALKERLDKGEKIVVSARLEVPEMLNIQTEYSV